MRTTAGSRSSSSPAPGRWSSEESISGATPISRSRSALPRWRSPRWEPRISSPTPPWRSPGRPRLSFSPSSPAGSRTRASRSWASPTRCSRRSARSHPRAIRGTSSIRTRTISPARCRSQPRPPARSAPGSSLPRPTVCAPSRGYWRSSPACAARSSGIAPGSARRSSWRAPRSRRSRSRSSSSRSRSSGGTSPRARSRPLLGAVFLAAAGRLRSDPLVLTAFGWLAVVLVKA